MITQRIRDLARRVSEGETEAAPELLRLLERTGFGKNSREDRRIFSFGEESFSFYPSGFRCSTSEQYRISFAWWPGSEVGEPDVNSKSPKFFGSLRHWHPKLGYIINEGPEFTELLGSTPKRAAATVILAKGPSEKDPWEVKPWSFGGQTYSELSSIHRGHPLGEHDLLVRCIDNRFRRLQFNTLKGCHFRKTLQGGDEKIRKEVLWKTENILPELEKFIGKRFTLETLRESLQNLQNESLFELDLSRIRL